MPGTMHTSQFLDTGIIDLLESDPRPSFIVARVPQPPSIIYTNPAFTAYAGLLDDVTAERESNAGLWEWIVGSSASGGPPRTSLAHANVFWTRTVVHDQMVIVGANEQAPSAEPPRKVRLDAIEPQDRGGGSVSPPPRAAPALTNGEVGIMPGPVPTLLPDFAALRRAKTTPGGVHAAPGHTPIPGPEAVRPISRSTSDPGWIVPDMPYGTSPDSEQFPPFPLT